MSDLADDGALGNDLVGLDADAVPEMGVGSDLDSGGDPCRPADDGTRRHVDRRADDRACVDNCTAVDPRAGADARIGTHLGTGLDVGAFPDIGRRVHLSARFDESAAVIMVGVPQHRSVVFFELFVLLAPHGKSLLAPPTSDS